MKVLCISRNGRELVRAKIQGGFMLIGRSPSCDVVLRAKGVMPVHYILEWMGTGRPVALAGAWTITDVSARSGALGSIAGGAGFGDGWVVGDRPVTIGGFEFSWKEDRLAVTVLRENMVAQSFRRVDGASNEERAQATEYQLQMVSIRTDSGAVAQVAHMERSERPRRSIRFAAVPGLKAAWSDEAYETSMILDLTKLQGAKIFRRGGELDVSGMQAPVLTKLTPDDFIQIRDSGRGRDHYLRLVPKPDVPLPTLSLLQDPFYRASLIASVVAVIAMAMLSAFHESPIETPVEPPRIAKIEVKELIPQKPRSEPAPPKVEEIATVAAPKHLDAKAVEPRAGLDSPAPKANVNTVGLLGAIKKTSGTVKTDQLLNDAVLSQTVSGDQGKFVVQQPPSGALGRKIDTASELSAAYTRLSAKDSASGKLGGPLAARNGKGEGWKMSYSQDVSASSSEADFSTEGGLDKNSVRAALAAYRKDIRTCYEKSLAAAPTLKGRILYKWKIVPMGTVETIQLQASSAGSPSLGGCVQEVIRSIRFPKASRPTLVVYPFEFQTKR